MSLSTEELETMLASLGTPADTAEAEQLDARDRSAPAGRPAQGGEVEAGAGAESIVDVASLFEGYDDLPTLPALFPDWGDLFRKWPFVRLASHPKTSKKLLLVGYAFAAEGSGVRLDNAKVGSVMFSNLVSICIPFSRSNGDDTKGLKVAVVNAAEGTRVTTWRNTRKSDGTRTPDERHAELVVQDGKLVRLA